jgi:hypothetical protein
MRETRIIACEACDGQGWMGVEDGGTDPHDGSATGYRQTCDCCSGCGSEEVEVWPVTFDERTAVAPVTALGKD